MLVASSLIATSAIVASAITNPNDDGPLAALLGRSLADNAAAATSPAPTPETASGPSKPLRASERRLGGSSPHTRLYVDRLPRSRWLRRSRIGYTQRTKHPVDSDPEGRSDQTRLRNLASQPRL